ncbi:DUF1330 domain-containing protein [Allopusillimonas soli]|uniref:DUF1330 domain-containing protein n=1 Tax=Allopusillimonas soli TaxID=659016 RepID=A0A853FC06_9BURK|nr:DUF1330 domain-containing protein [Allopusillimonas soli]NYT35596.1 DUF1330 domain-containing protein [Allopusillimonas soli]TEA75998.1 DUF1330 domain-containing protein [Allopusillimonas soli]
MAEDNERGYIYVEIEVTDPDNYRAHYMSRSTPAVQKYGGRFLVRGGEYTAASGDPGSNRIVILEFDSYDQALAFYQSPEYQEAMTHRNKYSVCHRYTIHRGSA